MAAETLDDVFGAVSIPDDLAGFMPDTDATLVGVGWITENYGIPSSTVYLAIHEGKLRAYEVPGRAGARTHVMRPAEVFRVWGPKLIERAIHNGKPASRKKSTTV